MVLLIGAELIMHFGLWLCENAVDAMEFGVEMNVRATQW